jgi:Zn-dependent protease with chaperone function
MIQAFVLSSDRISERIEGTLQIVGSGIRFSSAVESEPFFEFPVQNLAIELGGANNEFLIFQSPSQPLVSIFTRDRKILEDLKQFKELQPVLQSLADQMRKSRKFLWISAILAVALIGSVVVFKDVWVKKVAHKIPMSWEKKAGDQLFKGLSLQNKITPVSELKDKSFESLLSRIKIPPEHFIEFHLSNSNELNAFAFPGGKIVINEGLIQKAKSAEEILGVTAHEIGHVVNRHILQNILKSSGLFLLVQTLLGDVTGIFAVIADNGAFLLSQKYSRDFEREADVWGWELLVQSNIDPKGMIDFFKKIRDQEKEMMSKIPGGQVLEELSFLNTHPATEERITKLEEKYQALQLKQSFKPLDFDLKAVQDSLNERNP